MNYLRRLLDLIFKPSNQAKQGKPSQQSKPATTRRANPPHSRAVSGKQPANYSPGRASAYPGDFTGTVKSQYAPQLDGDADPGEIVWTWVPYEEDHSQGKDRPVLVVGRDGKWLLGLMLTSKDHSRNLDKEARYGRRWLDIGSGPWDAQGRDSEIRLDRVIRFAPSAMRREGAIVPKKLYDTIVRAI